MSNITVVVTDPPLNVSVEVSYIGHLNSTVKLTCSSVANPATDNYTWYRGTGSAFSSRVQVGSGQVLSIPSVEMSHTELYQCQARNHLGEDMSAEVLLTVDETTSEYTGMMMSFICCPLRNVFLHIGPY